MTLKETLIAARAKVAQGWVQGVSAKNFFGDHIDARSEYAVCWCATGAVQAANNMLAYDSAVSALVEHIEQNPPHTAVVGKVAALQQWNDRKGRTQAEVLALFDKAIEAQS